MKIPILLLIKISSGKSYLAFPRADSGVLQEDRLNVAYFGFYYFFPIFIEYSAPGLKHYIARVPSHLSPEPF